MVSALAVTSPLKNFQGPIDIARRAAGVPYQSAGIPFNEWLAQLTLCFAPFAAHILSGVPTTVMAEHSSPSWTSRINFYNPTNDSLALLHDRRPAHAAQELDGRGYGCQ
jgi:hypothetical protein